MHLIFNMLSLFFLQAYWSLQLGPLWQFLLIYFASMAGRQPAFAASIYKNKGDYTSVGASGAVNGGNFRHYCTGAQYKNNVLARLAVWPCFTLALPSMGVRSKRDNVGHEAHSWRRHYWYVGSHCVSTCCAWFKTMLTILIIASAYAGVHLPHNYQAAYFTYR